MNYHNEFTTWAGQGPRSLENRVAFCQGMTQSEWVRKGADPVSRSEQGQVNARIPTQNTTTEDPVS